MRGECAEQMNLQLKSQNVTHKDADEVANRGNKERRESERKALFTYAVCSAVQPVRQTLWDFACGKRCAGQSGH